MILKRCIVIDPACATVVLPIIPVLLSQYTSNTPTMRKETVMDALLALLEANRALYGTKSLITSTRTCGTLIRVCLQFLNAMIDRARQGGETVK